MDGASGQKQGVTHAYVAIIIRLIIIMIINIFNNTCVYALIYALCSGGCADRPGVESDQPANQLTAARDLGRILSQNTRA